MGLPKGLNRLRGNHQKKIVIGHTALYKMITDKSKNRPPKGYDNSSKCNNLVTNCYNLFLKNTCFPIKSTVYYIYEKESKY